MLYLTISQVGPPLGFSFQTNTITTLSPTARVTFTSKRDIGAAVAQLAVLSKQQNPPSELAGPKHAHVKVAGYTVSAYELARDVEKARSVLQVSDADSKIKNATIKVEVKDIQAEKLALKEKVQSGNEGYLVGHLWFALFLPVLTFRAHSCSCTGS